MLDSCCHGDLLAGRARRSGVWSHPRWITGRLSQPRHVSQDLALGSHMWSKTSPANYLHMTSVLVWTKLYTPFPVPCSSLLCYSFFFFWICHRRNIPLSKVLFLFPPGGHQVDASHSQAKAQRSLCGGTRLSRTRPCILSLSPLFTSLFRMCYLLTWLSDPEDRDLRSHTPLYYFQHKTHLSTSKHFKHLVHDFLLTFWLNNPCKQPGRR